MIDRALVNTIHTLAVAGLVIGCTEWLETGLPEGARLPTAAEQAAIAVTTERWQDRLPLSSECREFVGRTHLIDADADDIETHCWRCSPEPVEDGCDAERFGRVAACMIDRDDSPVLVIWDGLGPGAFLYATQHETTHALGACAHVPHRSHTEPDLWGPDGVHPL